MVASERHEDEREEMTEPGRSSLYSGPTVDRGHYGIMWAIKPEQGVSASVIAVEAQAFFGEDGSSCDASLYVADAEFVGTQASTLGWKANLTSGHSWRLVASARLLASEPVRMECNVPVIIGECKAFYLHTTEGGLFGGIGFSSNASAVTAANDHIHVLVGTRTESASPFESNREYKAGFAGKIEYEFSSSNIVQDDDAGGTRKDISKAEASIDFSAFM